MRSWKNEITFTNKAIMYKHKKTVEIRYQLCMQLSRYNPTILFLCKLRQVTNNTSVAKKVARLQSKYVVGLEHKS